MSIQDFKQRTIRFEPCYHVASYLVKVMVQNVAGSVVDLNQTKHRRIQDMCKTYKVVVLECRSTM